MEVQNAGGENETTFCYRGRLSSVLRRQGRERRSVRVNRKLHATPDLADDIMAATQLRHLKLAYAGTANNWDLARYESG